MQKGTTTFGRYMRDKRIAAGRSLRDLAAELDVSHVYLGEVERGVSKPLREDRWPALVAAVPGITLDGLKRASEITKGVQLELNDAPAVYQNLALSLARRIKTQDLSERRMQQILELLDRGDDE